MPSPVSKRLTGTKLEPNPRIATTCQVWRVDVERGEKRGRAQRLAEWDDTERAGGLWERSVR
eukprot:scaffold143307_cov32-Tisochrysis_lutea.AAC.3